MIDISIDIVVRPLLIESRSVPAYCCLIDEVELDDGLPWYHDIYQRSVDGMLLLCLDRASADRDEISSYGNCCQFVQRCPECQIHRDLIHSFNGHEFILVVIDYFTKWVEAASYVRLTSSGVTSFIRSHIIYHYGVSHELISDRGVHFRADVDTLLERYGIQHH
ncbi:hypothetical protein CK203_104530 [Vitis vinifera]|uniref:Integrase catalytic domain-containing protein n=1 Tax=Vitis vinifera TaxID=29760 RepID=A0A438D3R3_VITVI|nr:hypothetical protein CK203_104530 [Vitis vinifera]